MDCNISFFLDFNDQDSQAYTAVFLSLSVLTVVLNALVIITIWKDPFKDLKGIPNYLILNLAFSDLLVGIPAELLIVLCQWYHCEGLAKAADMSVHLGFYSSAMTLLVLAIARLIAVSYPLKMADYLTYTNLTLGILAIWFFAGLIAFLPELEWHSVFRNRVIIFNSIGIPILTLTVACYAKIFFLVKKDWHQDAERQLLTENARQKEMIKKRERKLIRCVAILVGLLIVCWVPRYVLANIALLGESRVIHDTITRWLFFLHPLVNPIAYSLCTRKFRRALWKIICRCNSTPPRCAIVQNIY